MSLSPYQASVPAFVTMLTNIKNWLDKAAAQKPEAELIDARLTADMYPLSRQVQIVSDTAKGAAARRLFPDDATLSDAADATVRMDALDPAAVTEALTAGIADELSRQYFLGYSSSLPKDGRWHTIDVRLTRPGTHTEWRLSELPNASSAASHCSSIAAFADAWCGDIPTRRSWSRL